MKRFYFIFIVLLLSSMSMKAEDIREIILTTPSEVYKYQYVYNQENELIMEVELVYDNGSWVNHGRISRSYTNGLLTLEAHELYKQAEWVTLSSMTFEYADDVLSRIVENTYSSDGPSQLLSSVTTDYELISNVLRPVKVVSGSSVVSYNYSSTLLNGELDEMIVYSGAETSSLENSLYRVVFEHSTAYEISRLEYYSSGEWVPQFRFTSYLNDVTHLEKYQTIEVYKQTPIGMSWVPLQSASFETLASGGEQLTARTWLQMAWTPLSRFEKDYDNSMRLSLWSWQNSIYNVWREMARVEYDSLEHTATAQTQLSFWGRDMSSQMPFITDFLTENNLPSKYGESLEVIYGNRIYTSVSNILEVSAAVVYPNPTEGELFISSSSPIVDYKIYDLAGRLMLSGQPLLNQVTVNVSDLHSGVYMLRTTINGANSTMKIVKL